MNNKKLFMHIILLLLTTRIALTTVGVISRQMFEQEWGSNKVFKDHSMLAVDIWSSFDSSWYIDIAENGYINGKYVDIIKPEAKNYPFFPLYPILIRIVSPLTLGDNHLAGILISNICLIFAAYFLYKITAQLADESKAKRAIQYLFFFPFSFVFSGVFSESLFLMLLLIVIYSIETGKDKKALVAGFLMGLSRITGLFSIPAIMLLIEKKSKNKYKPYLAILPVLLGVFVFMYYLYRITGDPYIYFTMQKIWNRDIQNPFFHLLVSFQIEPLAQIKFSVIYAINVLAFLLLNIFTLPFAYWVLSISLILTPLASGIISITRYSIVIFPLYIYIAQRVKTRFQHYAVLTMFFLLQILFMLTWSLGMGFVI